MAEPLKNIYNIQFFHELSKALKNVLVDFDKDEFIRKIFNDNWETKELKQRMFHIATVLNSTLSNNFEEAVNEIFRLIKHLKLKDNGLSLGYMIFPTYIELFGKNDIKISLKAIEKITQYASCEFAIRQFIKIDEKQTMAQMFIWSKSKIASVRRLSSEGCRPLLPWAERLQVFVENPSAIFKILENLIDDESLFVRKSVANNLNDISKHKADLVIDFAKIKYGNSEKTDWIIKHACRTLLKNGNQEVMQIFGFGTIEKIEFLNFTLANYEIEIGNFLEFNFDIINKSQTDIKLRLEYFIYYKKANGSLSRKIYQINEKVHKGNSTININKKQSFKTISTRKFYAGKHQISVVINGIEFNKIDFNLV